MSDEVAGFEPKTARKILQKLNLLSTESGSYEGQEDAVFPPAIHFFAVTGEASPESGIYTAQQRYLTNGTPSTPDSPLLATEEFPLRILGPPMKSGLIVAAVLDQGAWVGCGYPSRVLDFGTGAQNPFIVEGGVLKIKTIKTDDGLTWTKEKITWDSTTC